MWDKWINDFSMVEFKLLQFGVFELERRVLVINPKWWRCETRVFELTMNPA